MSLCQKSTHKRQVTARIDPSTRPLLPTSFTMYPKKKQLVTKSTINPSSPMARYLSSSSLLSLSSAPLPTSSSIDLTSSPPPTTMSVSANKRGGGKTSYIWNHGKKIVHDGVSSIAINNSKAGLRFISMNFEVKSSIEENVLLGQAAHDGKW